MVRFESFSLTGRVDRLNGPSGMLGRRCGRLRYVRRGVARESLILTPGDLVSSRFESFRLAACVARCVPPSCLMPLPSIWRSRSPSCSLGLVFRHGAFVSGLLASMAYPIAFGAVNIDWQFRSPSILLRSSSTSLGSSDPLSRRSVSVSSARSFLLGRPWSLWRSGSRVPPSKVIFGSADLE